MTASGNRTTGVTPFAQWSSWWSHLSLLLPIWGVGMAWGMVRFVRGWQIVARLRRTVQPVDACEWGGLLEQVQRTLRVTAPPVFTSDCVTTPVAIGLWRPVVILPNGLLAALTPTDASAPGKAKITRDVAPTPIRMPSVSKVAAKPQGDSASK